MSAVRRNLPDFVSEGSSKVVRSLGATREGREQNDNTVHFWSIGIGIREGGESKISSIAEANVGG